MFWEQIKEKPAGQFKRLTGVPEKTFRLMVKAVKRKDEKAAGEKGNCRSRPFGLCVEDEVLLAPM